MPDENFEKGREEKQIDKRHKTKGIFFSYVKGLQKFGQEVKFLYLKEATVGLHLQDNDQLLIHLTSPTIAIHNRSLTLGFFFFFLVAVMVCSYK